MAAIEGKPCSVAGLYSLVDLQRLCTVQSCKLSEEAEEEILYTILKIMGPKLASKAVHKLIDTGYLTKESNEYEVEKILDKCFCNERQCEVYLVKWRYWPDKFNTWEPISNLADCEEALSVFNSSNDSSSLPSTNKRKHDDVDPDSSSDDEYIDETQKQIKDIFSKLRNEESKIDLLTLVKLSGIADEMRSKVKERVLKPTLRKHVPAWATKKRTKLYREHKVSLEETLKAWETNFNSVYPRCKPIVVENEVDLEAPPENFKFICDYLPMDGLIINSEPVMGCSCEEECRPSRKNCCPNNSDAMFAYTPTRKVRLMPGSAIYECNSKCSCDSSCRNRVVQHGSQVKLAIFKTKNGCGWGVKAKQKIKKGTFVMEYLGEIITQAEAENRGKVYDSELFTYLFDLDFDGDDCQFTIDARNYGNISHFVNHSCDPNMSVYGVWINNLDVRLPRIALFANRDIKNGEELSFDYKMTGDTSEEPKNLSGRERTPAKMSPFKHSPLRSPMFRKPLSLSTTTVAATSIVVETPDSAADLDSSFDELSSTSSKVTAKVNLFSDSQSVIDDIKDEGVVVDADTSGSISNDKIIITNDVVVFNGKLKAPLRNDVKKDLPDLLDTSTVSETASGSSNGNTSLASKSPVKPDFSCKNYRIVCHCGAKNCRKFLF